MNLNVDGYNQISRLKCIELMNEINVLNIIHNLKNTNYSGIDNVSNSTLC